MVGIGVGLGLVLALGQISGKLVEVQSSYMGWCPVKLNYIEPLLLSTIRFYGSTSLNALVKGL